MRIKNILNLAGHPLSKTVIDYLASEGCNVETVSVGVDLKGSISEQIKKKLDDVKTIPLDGTVPFAITLPGLSETTAFFLAELHGRSGTFPKILQIRRDDLGTFELSKLEFPDSIDPGVIDLEKVRLRARGRRFKRRKDE